jgi:carboxylesterase
VYIAGLSLGGLLTLLTAGILSPEKIALLAPAIIVRNPLIHLSPYIWPFIRSLGRGYESDPDQDPVVRQMHDEYWSLEYPRMVSEVYKLQKLARKGMKRVTADTLLIVTEQDRTVPMRAARILQRELVSCRLHTVVLQDSKHMITNDSEKERVAEEVIRWFSEGRAGQS